MFHTTSTAHVVTERPARYGKQMASHMGRKFGGEWDADTESGWVHFPHGRLMLDAVAGALILTLSVDEPEQERMEDVVARHLIRFGESDGLAVEWQRAAA